MRIKDDQKMKPVRALALGSLFAFNLTAANAAYDVVSRYKIIDDKLKTENMLRPIEHDFFVDIGATANKNLTEVISDVSDASKATGTDAEKLAKANEVLMKYDKTEQTLKVNVALGFPLPSFSAWDVKFKPNFRAYADVGANLGIRSQLLTSKDILDYFDVTLPADLQAFVLTLGQGTDVVAACRANAGNVLSASTVSLCNTLDLGKYIIPNYNQSLPVINIFAKADVKAGFFNNYTSGEHFFGNFNLYALGRADLFQLLDAVQISKGESISAPDTLNTEVTLQTDYRLGYRNTNYSIFGSVEELKLTKLKDAKTGAKEHSYGYDPLMRVHADATYRVNAITFQPFLGVHKRKGYGLGDGAYVGTMLGAYVWGDRLGLQMTGMADKQYLTITPRVKLWLMQLEYSLKKPLKATDGDVKLTALHTIDFRIFF
jgi:hypothetical protein